MTGAFEGTVTNSLTGDPIEGATAEIINLETGVSVSRRTDVRGRFYQGLLPPGVYRIRVTREGFQPAETLQRLNIARTGQVVPVPVTLDPLTAVAAAPSPVITAASTEIRAGINTLDARRSGSFNELAVALLPLGAATLTRSFDEFALLLPGVAPPPQTLGSVAGPGQGAGVGTAGQFSVNGLRSRANNFTVDGSDNNDEDIGVRRQGFVALVPQPIESIQEYQAITLLAPAQFGRNLGVQVNAVSKSGSAAIHGTLSGFFNSSQLNARNFFDTADGHRQTEVRSESGQRVLLDGVPIQVRNQSGGEDSFTLGDAGATLGGPVKREKTFYFLSLEHQRINATREESFAVPTVEQRGAFGTGATGIFENPFFAGTPAFARPMSGNAPLVWSLYPFPNHPEGIYGRNTFTQILPASARGTVLSAKLDHNFKIATRTQRVTGRYNFTDDRRKIPATGEALFSGIEPRVRAQNFSFFFNSQIGVKREIFNQVRLSYGRTRLRFDEVRDTEFLKPSRVYAGTPFLLNAPLIVNNTVPVGGKPNSGNIVFRRVLDQNRQQDELEARMPLGQVIVAGFSPIGVDVNNFPQRRVNNTYQLADVLTLRAGDHSLALGMDHRRSELNSDLPRVARPQVVYNGGPRLFFDSTGNSRLPLPNDRTLFLRPEDLVSLDAPNAFFLTVNAGRGDANTNLRYYQINLFAQDDWRLRKDLSLAAGLRYEYNTPPRENNNLIEQTFKDPALQLVPGLNRFIDRRSGIFDPDRNNLAPRVGLAYAPVLFGRNRLTVFRGGYGIFYDQALGAVVSQSRNVFPTFLTLNFGGFRAFNTNNLITFINPADIRIGNKYLVKPGTVNLLNPDLELRALLNYINGVDNPGRKPSPDALGITLPERKLKTPIAHHYSFAVEQQLSNNLAVSAAYVGTLGRNLLRLTTPNLGPGATISPSAFGISPIPQIAGWILAPQRSTGGVGAVYLFEATARSRYDSLQIEARGRYRGALQYQAAYTYSHAIDDVSDVFDLAGAFVLPQNSSTFAGERGSANFDLRHRFTFYTVFDLSGFGGKGLGWPLGGLQLASIGQFQSGQPFTACSIFDINSDGNLTDRLDATGRLTTTGDGRRPLRLATSNPFDLLAPFGQDGRVGRNTFRAGGLVEVDLAVIKEFKLAARRVSLRVDFFNLFNRANFGIPVRLLEAPGFGQATRTITPGFRTQFAVKYQF